MDAKFKITIAKKRIETTWETDSTGATPEKWHKETYAPIILLHEIIPMEALQNMFRKIEDGERVHLDKHGEASPGDSIKINNYELNIPLQIDRGDEPFRTYEFATLCVEEGKALEDAVAILIDGRDVAMHITWGASETKDGPIVARVCAKWNEREKGWSSWRLDRIEAITFAKL